MKQPGLPHHPVVLRRAWLLLVVFGVLGAPAAAQSAEREIATLTYAPEVPPPTDRDEPRTLEAHFDAGRKVLPVGGGLRYEFWTFNEHVPGPFVRARVGDTLEVHVTNSDATGMPHNIDFHAVTGPGGGALVLAVVPGEEVVAAFRLLHPGLYIYHCATPPVADHIANGMYGLVLVEPEQGLPKVDREYYVLQSEIYARESDSDDSLLEYSPEDGLAEHPYMVVFNGRSGALVGEGALVARTRETVRLFFGDIGPNLISSFHVIGEMFDRVWREGGVLDPPQHGLQTTLVPAGGATIVDFEVEVPGTYSLVDHAIFRIQKGAFGELVVTGENRPDIYREISRRPPPEPPPEP